MSSFIKKYNVGNISLDLPYNSFIHELPLLGFSDMKNSYNFSLVFNRKLKLDLCNAFNIDNGFKLNVQKKIVFENGMPSKLIDSNGKYVFLNNNKNTIDDSASYYNNIFTFSDNSKRILRIVPGGYEIENDDFSREVYNSSGDIISIYDKYNDNSNDENNEKNMSYIYDGEGKLIKIICNGKEVVLNYVNNKLSSLHYSNTSTSFVYSNQNLNVNHYSGVSFSINVSDLNYVVSGSALENASQVSFSKECIYSENTITLNSKEGSEILDTVVYRFPSSVIETYQSFGKVECINKNGVAYRYEFLYDDLLYSYEIDNESCDVLFHAERCASDVNIYKTLLSNVSNSFSGRLKYVDGITLSKDSENENNFNACVSNSSLANIKGNFLITGWIKKENYNSNTTIGVSNYTSGNLFEVYVPVSEIGKWTFFAINIDVDANYIFVRGSSLGIELKDIRVIYQQTHIIDDEKVKQPVFKEAILIDKDTYETFKFSDAEFRYETEGCETGIVDMSFSDVYRFLRRKILKNITSELYYENCKKVIGDLLSLKVKINDESDFEYISNYYLGYRYYNNKNVFEEHFFNYSSGNYSFNIMKTINGLAYLNQYLDSKLDLVKSVEDNLVTNYVRDNSLILEEELEGLYKVNYTYNSNNTINVTYQFNNVLLPTVTYYLDPIWGTVYRETVENGSDIIDTFDGDMSVLLEKEFVNGNSGLRHLFEYSKGNVSSLSCDNLNFDFSYDKGKLVKVDKFSSVIEESVYDDLVKTVYYPNQENTIYSKQFVFDKYNRLKSVVNELENTYSIHSDFNSETGDPHVNVDNGNAKLIISEDKIKGLKSRFSYNNDLLVRKEIASSSDYSDKVSNETFVYDGANRLIEKEFVHNIDLNSRVKDVITYEKEASVSNNDNRIKKNEFYINGVKKTEVNNEYDNYKRLKGKTYNFDEEFIVRKDFIYTKNEITNETMSFGDVLTDSVNYVYDNYGRIVSIVSDGKTILYKYDNYGRLLREDNQFIDKTIIYDYNNIGNIINKSVYDYTVNENPSDLIYSKAYQYDNTYKDRLISYGGTSIPYNTLACPTQLNAYNLTWTKGKLTSVYKGSLLTGTERYNYTYNAYGQRLTKVYNKTEGRNPITPIISGDVVSFNKNYIYDHSGRLINEKNTINYYQEGSLTQTIDYLYDGNLIIGIKYNNGFSINTYFFERNILGDVVGIYDTDGNLKVRYLYDAYGNCTISSETIDQALARVNPIRYRGYYYDVETGLYYCNSRYYSPELCRFISPDSIEYLDPQSINGLNLYCYCYNNPIMYADPSGHWIESVFDILSIGYDIYCLSTNDGYKDWKNWAALGLDVVCLILPIATGGSAIVRTADMANTIDNAGDLTKIYGHIDDFADAGGIIRRAEKLDFVDDGWDLVQGLNKTSDGFTISNRFIGTDIHTTFKYGSRVIDIHNRVDGIDDALRLVYELKPYNKRSIRQGIKQLHRYRKALIREGYGVYKMVLVVY